MVTCNVVICLFFALNVFLLLNRYQECLRTLGLARTGNKKGRLYKCELSTPYILA